MKRPAIAWRPTVTSVVASVTVAAIISFSSTFYGSQIVVAQNSAAVRDLRRATIEQTAAVRQLELELTERPRAADVLSKEEFRVWQQSVDRKLDLILRHMLDKEAR